MLRYKKGNKTKNIYSTGNANNDKAYNYEYSARSNQTNKHSCEYQNRTSKFNTYPNKDKLIRSNYSEPRYSVSMGSDSLSCSSNNTIDKSQYQEKKYKNNTKSMYVGNGGKNKHTTASRSRYVEENDPLRKLRMESIENDDILNGIDRNHKEYLDNVEDEYNSRNRSNKQDRRRLKFPEMSKGILKRETRKLDNGQYKIPIESNITNKHFSDEDGGISNNDICQLNNNKRDYLKHISKSSSEDIQKLHLSTSEENIMFDIFKKCADKERIGEYGKTNYNNHNNNINDYPNMINCQPNESIERSAIRNCNSNNCLSNTTVGMFGCINKPQQRCNNRVSNYQHDNDNIKQSCEMNYKMPNESQCPFISSEEFERRALGKPSKSNDRSRLGNLSNDFSYCNHARAKLKRHALCIIEQKRYLEQHNSGSDSSDSNLDGITRCQLAINSSDMRIGFLFRYGSKKIRKNAEDLRIEHEQEYEKKELREKLKHCERLINYNAASSLKNENDMSNLKFCKSCEEDMDCITKKRIQQNYQHQSDARKTLYSSGGAAKLLEELVNSNKRKPMKDYRCKTNSKLIRGHAPHSDDDRILDDEQLVNKYGRGKCNDPRFKIVIRKKPLVKCKYDNKNKEKLARLNCEDESSEVTKTKAKNGKSNKSVASKVKRRRNMARNNNMNNTDEDELSSKEYIENPKKMHKIENNSSKGLFSGFSWIPKSKTDMGY